MKKSVCLFLCLVLLCAVFAGCATKAPQTTEPPVTEVDVTTTEPATEPAEPLSFSLGSLPQIGAFTPNEKKEYFFSDGPHDVFEPRDDYGEIIPYCTDIRFHREVDSYTYEDENGEEYTEQVENRFQDYMYKFGLMTTDGRIITTGIYDYFGEEVDESGNRIFMCYISSPDDMFMAETHVIGADGSWMLTYDNTVNVMVENCLKNGVFHAQTSIYNEQESQDPAKEVDEYLLFDGTRLDCMEPYLENDDLFTEVIYQDEDYILLTQSKSQDDAEDDTDCICCGVDGTERYRFRVQGDVSALCDGVLEKRGYEDGAYVSSLLDLQGNKLLEPKEEITYDKNTNIILTMDLDEDIVRAYDPAIRELWQAPMFWDWVTIADSGVYIFDEEQERAYRITDGQPITYGLDDVDRTLQIQPDWDSTARWHLLVTTTSGDAYVYDYEGVKLAKVKTPRIVRHESYDSDWYEPQIRVENGLILCATEDQWYLYDLSDGKETVLPTHGITIGRDDDSMDYRFFEYLGQNFFVFYHSTEDIYSNVELYETKTGRQLDPDLVYFERVGNRLLIATASCSYVYQADGSLLLKLPNENLV